MKVFLSWSGEQSKAVAEALHDWLPNVLQSIEPWMSGSDIDAGARWSAEVTEKLSEVKFGIICLTEENLNRPWILFEAGALSKTIEKTYVCPYLYGIESSTVQWPLAQFQSKKSNKSETKELLQTMNLALGDPPLDKERFDRSFEKWWPDLI